MLIALRSGKFAVLFIYVFLLGLIVGSFVNVAIWRLPRRMSLGGRSQCVSCLAKIPWHDLIPLASFLILRGRCRQCGVNIRWQYPLVEFYSGLVFLGSFMQFWSLGVSQWLFTVFLLEIFLILAVIDYHHLILPDLLVILMVMAAVGVYICQWMFGYSALSFASSGSVIFNLLSAVILFSILFVPWLISGGRWLGLGDAKLLAVIGFIFGLKGGLLILYGAVVIGALAGLVLWLSRRATLKTKLPLGAFICIIATVYVFAHPWANKIIDEWLWTVFPVLYR